MNLCLLLLATSVSVRGYLKQCDFSDPSRISYSAEVWNYDVDDFDLKRVTNQYFSQYNATVKN